MSSPAAVREAKAKALAKEAAAEARSKRGGEGRSPRGETARSPRAEAARAPQAARPRRASRASAAPILAGIAGRAARAVLLSPDAGRLAVLGLMAASFAVVSLRVREKLEAEPGLAVSRRDIATTPLPPFLSERARADLSALPLPERVSALRPDLVPSLARSLELVPWVEEVESVRLDFPAGRDLSPSLHFALRAARPIARIRERGLDVLVTRSRRRVPPDRFDSPGRLPRIEGLPDETSRDRERSLDDALQVVAALEGRGLIAKLGLDAVSVANAGGKRDARASEVELVLENGTRIDWGRAGAAPGLSVEDRLARLEGFLTKGPALSQVERLSVRWDEPVYVLRPVVAEPALARSP